jgi:hypothetical protein
VGVVADAQLVLRLPVGIPAEVAVDAEEVGVPVGRGGDVFGEV